MKKIISIICGVLALVFLVKLVVIDFQNPDVTQKRIIIEHWRLYIAFFASLIGWGATVDGWFK